MVKRFTIVTSCGKVSTEIKTALPFLLPAYRFNESKKMKKLALGILSGLILSGMAHAGERPNIVFIAVDDLRPELGAYGSNYIKSPNIDRIGKEGMVFDRAYVQQAVCSPSRTSVMTGTRPDTTKVWDLVTHFRIAQPDIVSLYQHFKQSGYFVQGMGKLYHGGLDDAPSWSVPWQNPEAVKYALPENMALENRQAVAKRKDKAAGKIAKAEPASSLPPDPDGPPSSGFNMRGPAYEGADVPDNTFTDGKVAELALASLREMSKKKEPFFLAVGFIKPHLPFVSPKKYWDMYDPAKIDLAPNKFRPKDAPEFAVLAGGEIRNYSGIPETAIPDDMARKLKHGYYAAISYTDAQVGKVLDELDRLGLRKNTIVVLWGDHGWKLGEHDGWTKHSNMEIDTHAPLLVSAPGMKAAGAHSQALVEMVDIFPTLADLAGLPLPAHLEGTSLKPLLDNPQLPWKSAAFSQYPRSAKVAGGKAIMGYTMVNERYRIVQWVLREDLSKVVALELYDHQTDPQENQNIAKRPENAALLKSLQNKLNAGWKAAKPVAMH